jgi:uncharacterized protein YjiS (DUF1127 family)
MKMALAPNTRTAPFGAITTLNLINMFEGAVKSVSDWNAKRKTHNILSSLTDRELADIGLSRGDLHDMPTKF